MGSFDAIRVESAEKVSSVSGWQYNLCEQLDTIGD